MKKKKKAALYPSETYKRYELDPSAVTLRALLQHSPHQWVSVSLPTCGSTGHPRAGPPLRGSDAAELPRQPRGTGTQAAEQVAAHAASPTCCPVPRHNELVRPCYCHREQMSAGQRGPASPGRAPAARCEALLEPLLGASRCSGGLACVSSGLISLSCFHPLSSTVPQPLLTALCRIFGSFLPSFTLFAVFCLAQWDGDFSTELFQCSLSSGTPKHCTVHCALPPYPSGGAHAERFPFLRQYLVACSHTAPLN